ncbi:MAG: hypothetical protein QMD44_08665 [Thermodesulfovibrionales bacterium]|nr:hypothetical protein [Thermodesulfovibrionales bacterium]
MKRLILALSAVILSITVNYAYAANRIAVSINPPSVQANMGDTITYTGTITNNSDKAANNIIAYISLSNVTQGKESPMDLEDWSANKAIKIDTIQPHGTYGGKWPMRLIDSGSYVAYITVVDKNSNIPVSSEMSHLEVKRILRLNPNNVLPVAIGEPLIIGIVFMFVALRRRKGVK